MFLLSVFELSDKVEDALTALEIEGIPRDALKAVPLESRNECRGLFDTVHYSDSSETFTLPFVLAMFGTFFGVIYGFQLYWGPILWGFIGAVAGFAAGMVVSLIKAAYKKKDRQPACKPQVIVIVRCPPDQSEKAASILWTNAAMGVRRLS